jgi:hypothetical protein
MATGDGRCVELRKLSEEYKDVRVGQDAGVTIFFGWGEIEKAQEPASVGLNGLQFWKSLLPRLVTDVLLQFPTLFWVSGGESAKSLKFS